MTILSIVVLVFYEGFVLAARVNRKSNIQHKSTSLTQNIVEALKSKSMGEILNQFENPIDTDGNIVFDLLPNNFDTSLISTATIGSFAGSTDDAFTLADDGITHVAIAGGKYYDPLTEKYVKTGDRKYYLYLRNLNMDNQIFDALITIDGSNYTETATSGQSFNDEETVKIPNISAKYDAIATYCADYDAKAVKYFKEQVSTDHLSFNADKVSRVITVTINQEDYVAGYSQIVDVVYQYYYDGKGDSARYAYGPYQHYVFDNSSDYSKQLRNVYLYFVPMLSNQTGVDKYIAGSDEIVINRNFLSTQEKKDISVFLVKQQPKAVVTATSLSFWENSYSVDVKVNEKDKTGVISSLVGPSVRIRTNLGYSLLDQKILKLDPADDDSSQILQAKYYFNNVPVSDPKSEDQFDLKSLSAPEVTDKLLNVTIELYDHTSDAVPSSVSDFRSTVGELQHRADMEATIRN